MFPIITDLYIHGYFIHGTEIKYTYIKRILKLLYLN